jgi:hypothetical protein
MNSNSKTIHTIEADGTITPPLPASTKGRGGEYYLKLRDGTVHRCTCSLSPDLGFYYLDEGTRFLGQTRTAVRQLIRRGRLACYRNPDNGRHIILGKDLRCYGRSQT